MSTYAPIGVCARGTAWWLLRVFDLLFGHGEELREAMQREAHGVCFLDSSDSDAALAWALAQGWIAKTKFQPTFQQRAMGMGGGSACEAYLTAWGFAPVRDRSAEARAWCAKTLTEFAYLRDPGPLAACEVHEWPDDRLADQLVPLLRERHGRGSLNVCIDCLARAKATLARRCGIRP